MPAERGKPDSRGLNWFDITDFSPGIYDNSAIAFGTAPNTVPGILPAPPGAADATNTYGCIALNNGGLGPLPAIGGSPGTAGLDLTDMGITVSGATDISALTNSFMTTSDELIIGVTTISGATQTTNFFSYVVATTASNELAYETTNYTSLKNFVAYPFSTTMLDSDSVPVPEIVLVVATPDGAPFGYTFVYPEVNSRSAFALQEIKTTDGAHEGGISFGHQGRIVIIRAVGTAWPVVDYAAEPFSAFIYTDPPESTTLPIQNEAFGPEFPYGYGAVNSVSAGELFCVKVRGGAIIIQGDLNNPTVTTLPGVKSTGHIYGRTDTDQNGMYYCSQQQGAWAWNGGNSSQKVSSQLDDNFFVCANPIASPYYSYYCQRWNEWMLFSNNWLLHSGTGSWWRLENPAMRSYFWYVPGYTNQWMFAALPTVASGSTKFLFEYDRTVPRASYTWQSLPIKMPAEDRTVTIREVVIRASNPYHDAAPVVATSLIDDKGTVTALDTWTMTTGTGTVQEIRLNAGEKQTTTMAIRLTPSGTTYAPVIHSVAIGYRTREHAALA